MKHRSSGFLVFLLVFSQLALAGDKKVNKKLAAAKVTLDLKDRPLNEVLRALSKASGVPIVVDPKVYQSMPAAALKVTMKVSRLSVDKTLALVFDMTGLDWSIVNGVVRVGDRRGSPQGALGQAHYVGDLMVVIRDFAAPGLGLMDAYPERPYTARELYGTGRVRQAPRLGFATQRLDQPFSDRTFVPLGTPQLESRPAFSRPIYRDRNRNAPWMVQRSAGGLSNPAVLIERLQAMTGGERVWERKGVGMRLLRGGRLWVVHTPELQQKIIAAIAKLRAGGQ